MLMLTQILAHTPRWVFVLFFALLALGIQQMFPRQVSLKKVSLLPAAMTAFSLYGVASAFSAQPLALGLWALGAALAATTVLSLRLPQGTRYDTAARAFSLPGSAIPLLLMMGVFFTKYTAGVALSQAPSLAADPAFALGFSTLYGLFSGLFIGRAARLWKLASVAATQSRLTYAA